MHYIKRILCLFSLVFLGLAFADHFAFAQQNNDNQVSDHADIKKFDARHSLIGMDYANQGNFQKCAEHLELALPYAVKDNAPQFYVNDLKNKLAICYIRMGQIEKGQALLKEVSGRGSPK